MVGGANQSDRLGLKCLFWHCDWRLLWDSDANGVVLLLQPDLGRRWFRIYRKSHMTGVRFIIGPKGLAPRYRWNDLALIILTCCRTLFRSQGAHKKRKPHEKKISKRTSPQWGCLASLLPPWWPCQCYLLIRLWSSLKKNRGVPSILVPKRRYAKPRQHFLSTWTLSCIHSATWEKVESSGKSGLTRFWCNEMTRF